jgi:hypothetical protein
MRPKHSDLPDRRDCRRSPASRRRRRAVAAAATVAAVLLIGVVSMAFLAPLRAAEQLGSGGSQAQQQVAWRQRSYRRLLLGGSAGALSALNAHGRSLHAMPTDIVHGANAPARMSWATCNLPTCMFGTSGAAKNPTTVSTQCRRGGAADPCGSAARVSPVTQPIAHAGLGRALTQTPSAPNGLDLDTPGEPPRHSHRYQRGLQRLCLVGMAVYECLLSHLIRLGEPAVLEASQPLGVSCGTCISN